MDESLNQSADTSADQLSYSTQHSNQSQQSAQSDNSTSALIGQRQINNKDEGISNNIIYLTIEFTCLFSNIILYITKIANDFSFFVDTHLRYGWCGFTPDCLQRFNNGVSWGVIAAIAGMLINIVLQSDVACMSVYVRFVNECGKRDGKETLHIN